MAPIFTILLRSLFVARNNGPQLADRLAERWSSVSEKDLGANRILRFVITVSPV